MIFFSEAFDYEILQVYWFYWFFIVVGITACTLAFAASLCGKDDVAVYDGSWTEFYLRSTPKQRVCPTDEQWK